MHIDGAVEAVFSSSCVTQFCRGASARFCRDTSCSSRATSACSCASSWSRPKSEGFGDREFGNLHASMRRDALVDHRHPITCRHVRMFIWFCAGKARTTADNWELDNPRESKPRMWARSLLGSWRLLCVAIKTRRIQACRCCKYCCILGLPTKVLVGSLLLTARLGGDPDHVDRRNKSGFRGD